MTTDIIKLAISMVLLVLPLGMQNYNKNLILPALLDDEAKHEDTNPL